MANFTPNENQINVMKHALGLDFDSPKRGKYEPHRNHYSTPAKGSPSWDELEREGYAIRTSDTSFHVSIKGLEFMEALIGAKILDYENVPRWGAICANCRHNHNPYDGTLRSGKSGLCVEPRSHLRACQTKPTNKCKYHEFLIGMAFDGFRGLEGETE